MAFGAVLLREKIERNQPMMATVEQTTAEKTTPAEYCFACFCRCS